MPDVKSLKVYFTEKQIEDIIKDMRIVLSSGQLAAGKYVSKFEENWAKKNNCKYGIGVSSGGAALEIIFKSLNIKDKEVIVPTNTFVATSNAVSFAGGKIKFADISKKDMCLDLENIKKNLTEKTKAVCLVHIGGIISSEIEKITKFCEDNKIFLVEDAAHGHGSSFNSKFSGQFGIAAAYSFFSTKTLTSGEGGMILTDDDELDKKFRSLRDYGKKSQWESFYTDLSSNYRMSNVTAIIGEHHSRELDNFLSAREKIASYYTAKLNKKFEKVLPVGKSSWYKYIVYLPKNVEKKKFKEACKEKGVQFPGGVYDMPLHLQPIYKEFNLSGILTTAEEYCERHICLPMYPNLEEKDYKYIVEIMNQVIDI